MPTHANVRFIQPMLLLRAERLPDGRMAYELKLDGFHAVAFNNPQLRLRYWSTSIVQLGEPSSAKAARIVNVDNR
jgi:hypothetical protein